MKNTNIIINSKELQDRLRQLEKLETYRIFCKHNIKHFLDVARICYILSLEKGINVDKDIIYSAAILHDLGRVEEILYKTPHNEASCDFAKIIFQFCEFKKEEEDLILSMILNHRKKSDDTTIEGIFYMADKLSRECFLCGVQEDCNWPKEKKNLEIKY